MTAQEVLALYERTGALLKGHFLLSSGLHSSTYLQSALVLQYPEHAEALGAELAGRFREEPIDLVIAPALGGIIVAHEVARPLGVRALFAEREGGEMRLRRGFAIRPGERCLVVEDVVTTGGSTKEVMGLVQTAGGVVVGAGALVDRSGGAVAFPVRHAALVTLAIENFPPESCPFCRQGFPPLIKPGSRIGPAGGVGDAYESHAKVGPSSG